MNPFVGGNVTLNQAEYRLQVAVVKHLQSAFPSLLFTHVPNRSKDAQDGFFRKQMGVLPGVPDLIFWYRETLRDDGRLVWSGIVSAAIELKASKGRSSNDQNRFASSFVHIGGKYAVCKSVKEAHDALVSWGLEPRHDGYVEPDTRSDNQKKADSFDYFKP